MIFGQVVGSVWGTRKSDTLVGAKLLTVRTDEGDELVAVDQLAAGPGDRVLVASGSRVRDLTVGVGLATKAVVIAVVDDLSVEE